MDNQSADEPILITLCLHDLHHSVHGYAITTSVTATFSLISQHASANQIRRLAPMTVILDNVLHGHRLSLPTVYVPIDAHCMRADPKMCVY